VAIIATVRVHSTTIQTSADATRPRFNARRNSMDIKKAEVWLLGDRNYPLGHVKLPAAAVADLPDLVRRARDLNPASEPDDVVRAIWRLGSSRLFQNLVRGLPVRVTELPMPVD
jgi:hypothetical protein